MTDPRTEQYRQWHRELAGEPHAQDPEGFIAGFWRVEGARTKPDYPCAVYYADGGKPVFSVGRKRPDVGEGQPWMEFRGFTFPKCRAVTEAEYHSALETGAWHNGKPSRQMTDEERAGTASGANDAPLAETLADQIAALRDRLSAAAEPTNQVEADVLAGQLDRMRLLLKQAEAERVKEKEPHLQAGRDVDAKWQAIGGPGKQAYETATARQKAYFRKEQERLDKLAREEAERKRRAAEEAARIAAEEAAQRAADAETEQDRLDAERAFDEATAPIAAPKVGAQRVTAGSAYGRATGLRKVKVGRITDIDKMIAFLRGTGGDIDSDFLTYLEGRAKAAARANFAVPGVTIEEELQ